MKKYLGFNFVELLLVMAILGVLIALTMPLLKNIKDDDDIYRAYMKKANKEVADIFTAALIKNRVLGLTGLDRLGNLRIINNLSARYGNDCTGLRNLFATAARGTLCGTDISGGRTTTCFSGDDAPNFHAVNNDTNPSATSPGIKLPGRAVLMFVYEHQDAAGNLLDHYGYAFIDINGDKKPNALCQDRYRFKLYRDTAQMEGCDMALPTP